jgi:hypothetical protein
MAIDFGTRLVGTSASAWVSTSTLEWKTADVRRLIQPAMRVQAVAVLSMSVSPEGDLCPS